jgi:hypothetical protein
VAGLRDAIASAVSYSLGVLKLGEEHTAPIPPALASQARLAAKNGVTLDTVLRRYVAGYTLLFDYLMEAAEEDNSLDIDTLHQFGREQAALLETLVSAMTDEYLQESENLPKSVDGRRLDRVRRLLRGEPVDSSPLEYELDGWHIGLVVVGEDIPVALRRLAVTLGRNVLTVPADGGQSWAWIGGPRVFGADEMTEILAACSTQAVGAVGEPARGAAGWRLTHRQARIALPIARNRPGEVVRYSDVGALASLRQDELASRALRELYLVPLEAEKDGGKILRETLRAYFAAEHNASSAAAALGVSRRTVSNRLRTAEVHIGRPIAAASWEIEAALRLAEF